MALKMTHHPHIRIAASYTALALLIMLPMLRPGHILTLDMAFTPHLPMPEVVSSSYLFRVLLHTLNAVVPATILEKLLLFTILIVSGYGMHRLIQYLRLDKPVAASAYLAGFLYTVNPYTYDRFMAGQYSVLLGYALLPIFCKAYLRLLAKPTQSHALKLAGWTVLISIVSIHTLGLVAVIGIVAGGLSFWRYRQKSSYKRQLLKSLAVTAGVFVLASCYWLVPLLFGQGPTATTIQSFGSGDTAAFATVGSNPLAKAANVVRLQGFWAEDRGLFLLPQDQMPGWGLIVITLWIIVFLGGKYLWQSQRKFIVIVFGGSALIALLLALGMVALPGFREPQKFVGLVALMYAVLFSQGITRFAHNYRKQPTKASAVTAAAFVLCVALTPIMFLGFCGQLSPRHYPADWQKIDQKLSSDADSFQTLFLPWHLYMHFAFAGRIIANPAESYFEKPVLVSNDPEFNGASVTSEDPIKQDLGQNILPNASQSANLGEKLAAKRIKYIIFAKESDAPDYDYLDKQSDLELIQETDSLKLYRNKAWKEGR